MSDDNAEVEAAPTDPAAGLATAMIVITTVMLLVACYAVLTQLGHQYSEGLLK